ncbi:MAG TPA: citrate/2-methylcitrate synthase [Thermoanaerobaculia bacterium]|jgi:citrate synthase|nr:citrate/2-methylcitrate synthase [Thermoanaerobaculia bacterium]
MTDDPSYLTAAQTAAALGVTLPTLYAYVSRGLIASEPMPGEPRARRYRREEVQRLQSRQELRRHPETAAPRALAWGEPVLDSALTLIDGRRLYYRGRDAVELSRRLSVEQVAALLWTDDEGAAAELFADAPSAASSWAASHPGRGVDVRRLGVANGRTRHASAGRATAAKGRAEGARSVRTAVASERGGKARGSRATDFSTVRAARDLSPVERLQVWLPLAGAEDDAAWDLRPHAVARCGARILTGAAAVIAGRPLHADGIAATLASGWRPRGRGARAALSPALTLCADHELNVSTFAARCAASAEATPWDAVAAGLAALKGRRHGGESFRMEALLRAAAAGSGRDRAATAVSEWLRSGERLPGFGHRLYPAGDPRAAELLALAERAAPASPALRRAQALRTAVRELTGELPNLDFGIAALAAALRLPAGAPQAIFALGRTIGWIAHAIEEYGRGALIRPRARYVGPPPQTPAAS